MAKHHATVYKKLGSPIDLIAFPGYMLAGFKVPVEVDRSPAQFGNWILDPRQPRDIRTIGRRQTGKQSAGWNVVDMIPPAFLRFAGRITVGAAGDVALFESWNGPNERQYPIGLSREGYSAVFVAFYDTADDFIIVTPAQASRMVTKDFVFYGN